MFSFLVALPTTAPASIKRARRKGEEVRADPGTSVRTLHVLLPDLQASMCSIRGQFEGTGRRFVIASSMRRQLPRLHRGSSKRRSLVFEGALSAKTKERLREAWLGAAGAGAERGKTGTSNSAKPANPSQTSGELAVLGGAERR